MTTLAEFIPQLITSDNELKLYQLESRDYYWATIKARIISTNSYGIEYIRAIKEKEIWRCDKSYILADAQCPWEALTSIQFSTLIEAKQWLNEYAKKRA